jgi:hypothetical protein
MVDVVIPMRNGGATIRRAVASAGAQTVPPRRIIVVDDGSTDGGAELVRHDPRVEVIATPPVGVSHARNIGIAAAQAEFVAFLDCDDFWRHDKLEKQLAVARRRPDAAIVTCDHVGATPAGAPIAALAVRPRYQGRVFQQLLADCFLLGGWSSSMLVRRAALVTAGGYDESLRCFEDVDLCIRIAARHPLAACPETLACVVENPRSTMRRPATDEFKLEVIVQGLSVIEKWIAASDSPGFVAREAARFILSRFVLGGLRPRHLRALHAQMIHRTPMLAARIASTLPHLAVSLGLAGALGTRRLAAGAWRYCGRRAAAWRPRPLPALAPVAKTSA